MAKTNQCRRWKVCAVVIVNIDCRFDRAWALRPLPELLGIPCSTSLLSVHDSIPAAPDLVVLRSVEYIECGRLTGEETPTVQVWEVITYVAGEFWVVSCLGFMES